MKPEDYQCQNDCDLKQGDLINYKGSEQYFMVKEVRSDGVVITFLKEGITKPLDTLLWWRDPSWKGLEKSKIKKPKTPKEELPQNPSPYRFDLLPADAMLKIAECMAKGDIEHGRDNWKKIEASVHHGRSMGHMFEAKSRDQATREREDHYTHTALRAIFALQMAIEEGKVK